MRTSRVPNSPPSGIIHPPTHLSTSQIAHSLEESARTYTPELSRFFQRVEGSGHELTYREHSSYRLDAKARRLASMAHAITTARNTNPQCAPDWVAVTNSASLAEPCPACATPRNTAMTVVATAPESCWNVLNSALPSAFSSGGSTAIPHVIVLAKHMEKPSIYTKYHKPNMTIDDPAPINAAINTVPSKPTIMAVNIGRTGPNLSSSDPETGALAAPSNAPGSNTTPAASTDAPNPSCEAFGII